MVSKSPASDSGEVICSTYVLHSISRSTTPARLAMATTTIRIDDELKARVSAAAERAGQTPHAFILDAISSTLEKAELARDFADDADGRWSKVLDGGKTIAWDDMRRYLSARRVGEDPSPPKARIKRR